MSKPLPRLPTLWHSFAAKLVVLISVLVAVPAVLYGQFRAADAEKTALLQRSVQEEGRLIAASLQPDLESFQNETAGRLGDELAEIGGEAINVKLLFRPASGQERDSFFYIAASPEVSADYLERDRTELLATGILDRLPDTCAGGRPLGVRYTNPAGAEEVLTSITPVNLPNGCWIVVTSHASEDFLSSSLGRPYWKTAEAQLAAAIYLLMVVLVISLFVEIWRNVRRFGAVARTIRVRRTEDQSFRARNHIPELEWVAEEFDRLVQVLNHSATAIRQAAHENAHALKAPLAVIAQSVEPLKRALPGGDARAQRALDLIERSVVRLDATVSAAHRLEQATAELIDPPRDPVDVSALLRGMLAAYREITQRRQLNLETDIRDGVIVRGSEDLFETAIENLLENAVGFAPPRSTISVSLGAARGLAELTVADEGPGVPAADLERIFERYFSRRDGDGHGGANFGIGLWIVRRNVEALGGMVAAANREGGGLAVTLTLPLASPDTGA